MRQDKTRAAVLREQPGKWSVEEVDLDDPGPTEVLVEMVASGLCHSDDHATTGDMPTALPIVGGHEGSGIVRSVGSQVHGLAEGDHVITSFIPGCGVCKYCARGQGNLCNSGATILEGTQPSGGMKMHKNGEDIRAMGALGTFATWQVYDQISLVRIDPSIPLDVACLVACGVQTGYGSAVNGADVRPGDVVIVMGCGGVGMNAVQGAAAAGAAHVIAVDPQPFKREQAPSFGATEVFADIAEADAFAKSITNGQGADSAVVTIGVVTNEHIGQAFDAIAKAGTVVVTGISRVDEGGVIPGYNAFSAAMLQKRIQGALYGMDAPRNAMPRLLEQYTAGKLKLDELITTRYSLDDINTGYADMHAGRNIRGVIDYSL
ncbi:MAG: NDMA-dependent alcohol dehydrogenase [Nocardioides sp.]|uniref:NDMA-dependent alcohol dehydrogenase n=1 Tax=Nocardioides sp. TaxID=35761 RepID=UPI0039E5084C